MMNKNFYFRQGKRWETYVVWDTLRKGMTDTAFFSETKKLANHFKSDMVLVLSYPPPVKPANWYFLKSFNGAIVNDENYFIYLVKYFKPIKE
jgi:hypothetical protein